MVKKMIMRDFLPKQYVKYIGGFLALVASAGCALYIPKLLGKITDGLDNKTMSAQTVYQLCGFMLLLALFVFILKFVFRNLLIGGSRDLECFLRAKWFSHLQTLPPQFYSEEKTGDLMAYATNDLASIRMAFSMGLIFLVDGILINSASVLIMAQSIDIKLTFMAVTPVFLSVLVIFWLRKKIRQTFMKVQEAFADLSDKTQENISGIRVVKAYVQEAKEIEKLEAASQKRYKAQMNYVRLSALLNPVIQLNFGISFAIVLVVGGQAVSKGQISLGDFVSLNTYLAMLTAPLMQLSRTVEIWQKAFASIARLDSIFVQQTNITDKKALLGISTLEGTIEVKNLSFVYPCATQWQNPEQTPPKQALKQVSFFLKKGKTLALIGKTGSGKTTLASLLLRLYQIPDGHIFFDGKDINHVPLSVLREHIGYVPQDNFLFGASVLDNLTFFNPQISQEMAIEATKNTAVYENIMNLPEQFQTIVGERGITLSGGQKQRISMARAIAKDPSILILDDALSAVDTKTEETILANIKTRFHNKTCIWIAHRISTIKHADEILFMDEGCVLERGTHAQLLAQKGAYYKLYQMQALENEGQTEPQPKKEKEVGDANE